MLKEKKILTVIALLICFFSLKAIVYSENWYCVTGKVLRENKGVEGVKINISPVNIPNKIDSQVCETNKNGQFSIYLSSGDYTISCFLPQKYSEYIEVGSERLTVTNKNINNLTFHLYTSIEIIQANLSILNEIAASTPTINYAFGKIPIFSIEACKKVAEERMINMAARDNAKVLIGAKIGSPIIFVDLKNNPIFYQFPIVNSGKTVGCVDVHAVGIRTQSSGDRLSFIPISDISSKENPTAESDIPSAIEVVAEIKKCQKNDIELIKLLCLAPEEGGNLYAMFKIISRNENVLVSLYSHIIVSDSLTLDQIQAETEEIWTLDFIVTFKKEHSMPLM